MNAIDHTVAEFNKDALVRGYTAESSGSAVLYAKDMGGRTVHVIVSDDDGWFEYTTFLPGTVHHFLAGMVAG